MYLYLKKYVLILDRQSKHKNLMKDTWTLTLKNVQTGDRGPYMCQVRLFAEF